MTDSAKLVKRLTHPELELPDWAKKLAAEAATRITELEAERDRLNRELDTANNNHRSMAHQLAELGARLSAAAAEEREACAKVMRKTFDEYASMAFIQSNGFAGLGDKLESAVRSRAALKQRRD